MVRLGPGGWWKTRGLVLSFGNAPIDDGLQPSRPSDAAKGLTKTGQCHQRRSMMGLTMRYPCARLLFSRTVAHYFRHAQLTPQLHLLHHTPSEAFPLLIPSVRAFISLHFYTSRHYQALPDTTRLPDCRARCRVMALPAISNDRQCAAQALDRSMPACLTLSALLSCRYFKNPLNPQPTRTRDDRGLSSA